jgi:L-2-hydroxyglutarate oxidase LhgO
MVRRWWRTGVDELRHAVSATAVARAVRRFVPEIGVEDLLPGPAGVRGQAIARDGRLLDDFLITTDGPALHVRNAPSPAATACLALGRLIADEVERTSEPRRAGA